MIRDEVVLRTACGCEKILLAPVGQHVIRVRLTNDVPLRAAMREAVPDTRTRSLIRQFVNDRGWTDPSGRPVFCEWLEQSETEDWKHRYQELYREVYGMDIGL